MIPPLARPAPDPAPRRLWLHRVDETFDPTRDIAIDIWCFEGVDMTIDGVETQPFVSVYESTESMRRDSDLLRTYGGLLVERLATDFERRHGTDYGYAFWRILLIHWVMISLTAVFNRYRRVAAFANQHHDEKLRVPIFTDAPEWQSRDTLDLESRLFNAQAFNFWLTSRILRDLAPDHWVLEPRDRAPFDDATRPPVPAAAFAGRMRGRMQRLLHDGRCRQVKGIRLTSPLLSLFLSLLPAKPTLPAHRADARIEDIKAALPRGFPLLFENILMRIVPDSLGADFHRNDAVARTRRYRKGKCRLIGPLLHYNEEDRFLLAHAVRHGEHLVCTQHGGSGYQGMLTNAAETEFRQFAYLTWGYDSWNGYACRMVPVPSPDYAGIADRHRERAPRLILVGNVMRLFGHRLETVCTPPERLPVYRREKLRFLAGLDGPVRARARYRPTPESRGGLSDAAYVTGRVPDLPILEGPLHPRLLDCRLLVLDHPGSTLSFALAANVPTIVYLNPRLFDLAPEAAPVFAAMRDAGIFFETPEAAAAQANAVWNGVADWWRGAEVQLARRDFVHRYARTDRLWLLRWATALWRL